MSEGEEAGEAGAAGRDDNRYQGWSDPDGDLPQPRGAAGAKLATVERDCPASEVARQALREHLGLEPD